MTLISNQISALNRTKLHVVILLREILIEQSSFIEELNRKQLERGQRSDGSILPNYSPNSVLMGKPQGPIRLFDEGDFYEGIEANVFDDSILFDGEDPKTPMLIQRYGEMILGLTDESLNILISRIKPILAIRLKAFLRVA